MKLTKKHNLIGWIFIAPAILIIAVTKFYPMVQALITSFQTGVFPNMRFNGLANYVKLFSDSVFKTVLINTLFFLIEVPIMLILAMKLADLLNRKDLRLKGVFRTAIFLPCITAAVSYSIVFRSLFANNGIINSFLLRIGAISSAIPWMSNPWLARFVILLAMIWRWTGYNTIFYLSGMQSIDPSIYDAAKVDGATERQTFWHITIPQLKPILLLTIIQSINGSIQLFAEAKAITNGGPGNATLTLSGYIYKLCFEYTPQFGYASVISYVVLLIVSVLAIIQIKAGDTRD